MAATPSLPRSLVFSPLATIWAAEAKRSISPASWYRAAQLRASSASHTPAPASAMSPSRVSDRMWPEPSSRHAFTNWSYSPAGSCGSERYENPDISETGRLEKELRQNSVLSIWFMATYFLHPFRRARLLLHADTKN